MSRISYRGYRFPPDIIQRAVWLYFRFTLSFRNVEDLLAERGIEVSYETIRQWTTRFGPAIAQDLRSRRPRPHGQWHLDEMFVSIAGKWMYLWRAVDAEGKVLDCLVQELVRCTRVQGPVHFGRRQGPEARHQSRRGRDGPPHLRPLCQAGCRA